mmetsp:Transcript_7864/g.11538  ORF Transcript_7864/g.11538 Transcript_7864/m.11538 type:complete len:943 (-) Transcript_7864:132-2960(-)
MSSSGLIYHHVYPAGNANGGNSTLEGIKTSKETTPLAPPPSLNTSSATPETVGLSSSSTAAPRPLAVPSSMAPNQGNGAAPPLSKPLLAPSPTPQASSSPIITAPSPPLSSVNTTAAVVAPSGLAATLAAASNSPTSPMLMPSSPTFSIGSHEPPPQKHPPSYRLSSSAPARTSRFLNGGSSSSASSTGATNPTVAPMDRRQKRLERNRESARLSRRRRKQYLEVLEERVKAFSEEMDKGRFNHVKSAVQTVRSLRLDKLRQGEHLLSSPPPPNTAIIPALEQVIRTLDGPLSRTSEELTIASIFRREQLKSLVLPPPTKFVLWLTLQNDIYFRGGRAASERLSAARIGERMLQSGNDRVSPANGMWPLFCNEIGLSYDQEERVRNFQRTLLTNHTSWLHRHTASASGRTLQDMHSTIAKSAEMVKQRESRILNILTVEQRVKFLAWAARKSANIAKVAKVTSPPQPFVESGLPEISSENHEAANLYMIHHRMQKALEKLPITNKPPLVHGVVLRRLSRRPSFESLAGSSASLVESTSNGKLSRDGSFSSTGSLKRTASEQSCSDMHVDCNEGDKTSGASSTRARDQVPAITPEAAQKAASPTVSASLGCVAEIVPPPPSRPDFTVMPQQQQPPQMTTLPPQPYSHHPQQQPYHPYSQQLQYHPSYPPQTHYPPQQQQQQQQQTNGVAQLPPGWVALQDLSTGNTYYANQTTGESSWEMPRAVESVAAPAPSQQFSQHTSTEAYQQQQSTAQHATEQQTTQQQSTLNGATPSKLVSKYGDGFVTSSSHPELGEQYGNVGTSNPYGGARSGIAAVNSTPAKPPISGNLDPNQPPALSAEYQPISDGLLPFVTYLSSVVTGAKEKKEMVEIEKGVAILLKKLARGDINSEIAPKVMTMVTAMQNRDYGSAAAIQKALVNSDWKEHKDWLRGIKFLIQFASKRII